MPVVAYSVSVKVMVQLQFWAGHDNYREYQNVLWTVGEEISRADDIESNVVLVYLDWLASEEGLSFSCPQHHPFSLDCHQGFFVYLQVSPLERKQQLRAVESLPTSTEWLRNIPAAYGMESGREEAFVSIHAFLQESLRSMADREDETLVIASC
jgi:hypothetical protein